MSFNSKIGSKYFYPNGSPFNAAKDNVQYAKVKRDPIQVIAKLIRNQHSLFNKEIMHWKSARLEAEDVYYPRRVMLMDLYKEIALDPFIQGVIKNKRVLKISNKPFKLNNKDGSENKDLALLLQKGWFNKFIKLAMESRFYGYSLVYFWEMKDREFIDVKLVDRRHVMPQYSRWLRRDYDMPSAGFDYREKPFADYMIGCGDPEDLGLLNPAAPLYVLKKHSWANWDEFEEIFGIPMRIAKIASQDPAVRREVEKWLESMGTAAYGIFPQDTELEIKENNRTDAFEVFDRKRKACNEELEILLLGNRSLTQDNGNYGKEKVTQEEQDEIVEDDKVFIANLVNEQVIPLLRINGYPLPEGVQFVWDESEWLNTNDRLAVFEGVHRLGYKLNQEQVQKDLGVEITGEQERPASPFDFGGFGGAMEGKREGEKEGKGAEQPKNDYRSFHRDLMNEYFPKTDVR